MVNQESQCREGGKPYGLQRVLSPSGALPQNAERLDNALPIYDNEMLVSVETLNIDSASFQQMVREAEGLSLEPKAHVIQTIQKNVQEKGKQINRETGSGGMLIGTVQQLGPKFENSVAIKGGERIASLISLTLTPIDIDEISEVHLEGARHAQVEAKGYAILPSHAPFAKLPEDLSQSVCLSALDVCGAPAQVNRLVSPGQTVVVIGAGGKSGMLSLCAARNQLQRKQGCLIAVEFSEENCAFLRKAGLADHVLKLDARDAFSVAETVAQITENRLADVVINTANVADTEMAAILSAKEGGTVYFFNMATEFSKATLGAEGVGKDVCLMMGNGFVPGHAEFSLNLLRNHKEVYEFFKGMN